jgi:hypothetical protein
MRIITYPSQQINQTAILALIQSLATASGTVIGSSTFLSPYATLNHDLGSLNHFTCISIEGTGAYDQDTIAMVGEVYVQLGTNQDKVYATGSTDANGIPFSWLSTTGSGIGSGAGATDISVSGTGGIVASYSDSVWVVDGAGITAGTVTNPLTETLLPDISTGSGVVSAYSLGSETHKFDHVWARDLHADAGSIYVNNKKVIEDVSDTIIVRTDTDQDLSIRTYGTGDASIIAEHLVITQGRGGLEANVPSTQPSKNITLNNYSTNGSIDINGVGANGDVNFLATRNIDFMAETATFDTNVTITGTLQCIGTPLITLSQLITTSGNIITGVTNQNYASQPWVSSNYIGTAALLTTSGDLAAQIPYSAINCYRHNYDETSSNEEVIILPPNAVIDRIVVECLVTLVKPYFSAFYVGTTDTFNFFLNSASFDLSQQTPYEQRYNLVLPNGYNTLTFTNQPAVDEQYSGSIYVFYYIAQGFEPNVIYPVVKDFTTNLLGSTARDFFVTGNLLLGKSGYWGDLVDDTQIAVCGGPDNGLYVADFSGNSYRLINDSEFTAASGYQLWYTDAQDTTLSGALKSQIDSLVDTDIAPSSTYTLTVSGGVCTPDFSRGNYFTVTLVSGANVLNGPTNATVNQQGSIMMNQPAAGGATVTFANPPYIWSNGIASTVTASGNALDMLYWHVVSPTQIVCTMLPGVF